MAMFAVPITKAKEDISDIDSKGFSDEVYDYIFSEGLKTVLNKGMTKVTAKDIPDEDERKAEAMKIAQATLAELYDGKVPSRKRAKKSKESGKVMTEARRLAKEAVKQQLRKAKKKISHYKASDITAAANALLETDDGKKFIATARDNIAAAEAETVSDSILADLHEDEYLVEKANEAAEARKSTKLKVKARPSA